ncbi:hypothetical protein FAZ95_27445 [Trinickia violacea]|uniref:Uncharacterized protein n=1 Tax=Trinickia violacea TaxID=2571746 RepID=A0A4P8IUQ6_9BURK|nr:hypothetical protein [Trinickia violacea]QCP52852.1 hypothetical protein FAZ95_27445 [Trinickia violacea]
MQVNLVKDANGKVIATFENPAAGEPSLRPELKPGHTVHVVEAADNYTADIKAFYAQHSR